MEARHEQAQGILRSHPAVPTVETLARGSYIPMMRA